VPLRRRLGARPLCLARSAHRYHAPFCQPPVDRLF
jgi:hypothetical protein